MKTLAFMVAVLLALLPLPALASGLDAPWWFGASLWLLGTPEGWAAIAVGIVAILLVIYGVARK